MSDSSQICDTNSKETLETSSSQVDEELELLHSIYVHELEVTRDKWGRPTLVTIDLHPATADKTEEQFVRLTLVFTLPHSYPRVLPEITIRNSRGLGDDDLKRIRDELKITADKHKGSQVLYQLIEVAKEYLTASNTPTGICAICLYGFDCQDVFTKTECYHHFHSQCLGRYISATLSEGKENNEEIKVVCPVCREVITYDMKILDSAPPPLECESADDFVVTTELKHRQIQMADLLQRQQERGGIIDVEAEKNKYLLEISEDSTVESSEAGQSVNNNNKITHVAGNPERQRPTKKEKTTTTTTSPLQNKPDASGSKRAPMRETNPTDGPNSRDGGKNKFRGRGGKGNSWSRPRHVEPNDDTQPLNACGETKLETHDRPRHHQWRGRGRYGSWHQQRREARNAEKRDAENTVQRQVKKEIKSVEQTTKESRAELTDRCIQSQALWGYGPPPSRFVRDPTQSSPSSNGRNSSTNPTNATPPPGFQARPPFPRTKPPPGFLAS